MRRAAAVVLVGGFAFWAIGSGLGHQPAIVGTRLTAAVMPALKGAGRTAPASSATKTVKYDGYEVNVPAGWPVYDLKENSHQCVRYDVNAVYLGTPGPDQDCPPNLIGRADTISIGGPAAKVPVRKTGGDSEEPAGTGAMYRSSTMREFALTMPRGAPRVNASYGSHPVVVERSLASVRPVTAPRTGDALHPAGAAEHNWPTNPPPPTGPAAAWGEPPPATPPPAPKPTPTTTALVQPVRTPPNGAVAGFDTCTAPSLKTMKAWRARYSATAIYIGGQMMACDYGNLSATWILQAKRMGYSLLPTFVGPQAPCDSFSAKINASQAASQGTAAANQAIANAKSFGLDAGTPIYYDMEAYDHTRSACRTAVLTFLDAWDRQLTLEGYVSGVYSSADAAIIDLQSTTTIAGHNLDEPQAVWFALWDNTTNLTGSPYLRPSVWPVANRSKQYAGNRIVEVGGISLDIDSDWVNSAVARG